MSVTGWKFPQTAANVSRAGSTDAWTYESRIQADDTSYAPCTPDYNSYSDWLFGSNFGFTTSDIPAGSTIDGIELEIGAYTQRSSAARDDALYLRLSGSNTGNDKASATSYSSSMATRTYGGATDTWGATLSAANVIDTTFGIALSIYRTDSRSFDMYMDYFKIRIYYTPVLININIGDAWKTIQATKINVSDVWKDVVGMKINIGDAWKTII